VRAALGTTADTAKSASTFQKEALKKKGVTRFARSYAAKGPQAKAALATFGFVVVCKLQEAPLIRHRSLRLLLFSYRGLVTSNHLATNQGGRGTQALVPPLRLLLLLISYRGLVTSNHLATNRPASAPKQKLEGERALYHQN